MQCLS